jgi:hypothetical protein
VIRIVLVDTFCNLSLFDDFVETFC